MRHQVGEITFAAPERARVLTTTPSARVEVVGGPSEERRVEFSRRRGRVSWRCGALLAGSARTAPALSQIPKQGLLVSATPGAEEERGAAEGFSGREAAGCA